jgi:TldD protein
MTGTLQKARKSLLEPAGIGDSELERLIGRLLSHQVDYADLYFQYRRHESWSLEESQVKSGSHNIEQGVGVRAISQEKTGFAYSDEIGVPALLDATSAARTIAQAGGALAYQTLPR